MQFEPKCRTNVFLHIAQKLPEPRKLKSSNRAFERNSSSKRDEIESIYSWEFYSDSTRILGSGGNKNERTELCSRDFCSATNSIKNASAKDARTSLPPCPLGACTKLQLEDLSRLFRVWSSSDGYANNSCSPDNKIHLLAFPRRKQKASSWHSNLSPGKSYPACRWLPACRAANFPVSWSPRIREIISSKREFRLLGNISDSRAEKTKLRRCTLFARSCELW